MKRLIILVFFSCLSQGVDAQLGLLHKDKSLPCLQREFIVMAHIVRDTFGTLGATEVEVQAAINTLNAWFDPICVRFNLAQVETIDNFQYSEPYNFNEWQQMWVNHNHENRINLYVVNSTANLSNNCVYADIEGILQLTTGGVMIQKDCLLSEYIVHAFGHYCGLLNTNEDPGSELVNGSNCAFTGDNICDTPADPYDPSPSAPYTLGDYVNEDCRFIFEPQDPNGEYYLSQTGNVMSDYPVECWCGFTYEQFIRMVEVIEQSELW